MQFSDSGKRNCIDNGVFSLEKIHSSEKEMHSVRFSLCNIFSFSSLSHCGRDQQHPCGQVRDSQSNSYSY